MAPVTEFARVPMKPGFDLSKDSDDFKIWEGALNTLLAQDGCDRIYYGLRVEDASTMDMIIDWQSHDAHMKFANSSEYEPFKNGLGPIMGGPPVLHHISFTPHPPRAALSDTSAPATEILNQYFPASTSSADKEKIAKSITSAIAAIQKETPSLRAVSSGWLYEDAVDYEKGPDGKATVFCSVLGWDSVAAHHEARGTKAFMDNINGVRQAPGILGMSVHHINATEVQRGG